MIYNINESICTKKGMDLPSLLAVLLVKTGVDINELFNTLVEKEILVIDESGYLVTQRWDRVVTDILASSDKTLPSETEILELADNLMKVFPTGRKEGTASYWRGNRKEIKERLQKFFKLYGNKYSSEEILDAARRYVGFFNGQYTYMRVLKYFIWKSDKKIDEEGKGYVEEVSDLATFIENAEQEDLTDDWNTSLK